MRFQLPDGQTIRMDVPFNYNGVQYPANWIRHMSPEARTSAGFVELPEEEPPNTPYVPTALDHIRNLEATITARRLRDALLTPEGKAWLADVEAQISTLRAAL